MKKCKLAYILLLCVLCLENDVFAQGGLILPMPGQKLPAQNQNSTQNQSNSNNGKTQKPSIVNSNNNPSQNRNSKNSQKLKPSDSRNAIDNTSGTIIPMPQNANSKKAENVPHNTVEIKVPATPDKVDLKNEPLITIPIPTANKDNTAKAVSTNKDSNDDMSSFFNDKDFPVLPNEVSATAESSLDALLDSTTQAEAKVSSTDGSTVSVFPKDTGSAIFMVMKSWKCDDYDCVQLLEQALEVYAKEAGDEFKISGYENLPKGLTIDIDEEDITIDEMLDIISAKSGRDWGADVASKVIYIYPQGIKTESYVSW